MPDFTVDSPTPIYVRVADWIESRITSGELKSGSRLPPERELAQDTGVAYDTIRRARHLRGITPDGTRRAGKTSSDGPVRPVNVPR
jgi:DNA-binding transcriptional MocR family regulator